MPAAVLSVVLLLALCLPAPLLAGGGAVPAIDSDSQYVAELRLHTAAELVDLLERADVAVGSRVGEFQPISVVLHGAEGAIFARSAYAANKRAVDLAARLDALQVVDIRICEVWMSASGLSREDILPFVGFVPDGAAEVAELRQEGYRYF